MDFQLHLASKPF